MPKYVTLIEVERAIKQTRQDLLELFSEIGREDYLRIFDEYNPADDEPLYYRPYEYSH